MYNNLRINIPCIRNILYAGFQCNFERMWITNIFLTDYFTQNVRFEITSERCMVQPCTYINVQVVYMYTCMCTMLKDTYPQNSGKRNVGIKVGVHSEISDRI